MCVNCSSFLLHFIHSFFPFLYMCKSVIDMVNIRQHARAHKHTHTHTHIYIYIYLLISEALQLLMQSFGLLNHFLPSSSILDKGLPIWHF